MTKVEDRVEPLLCRVEVQGAIASERAAHYVCDDLALLVALLPQPRLLGMDVMNIVAVFVRPTYKERVSVYFRSNLIERAD